MRRRVEVIGHGGAGHPLNTAESIARAIALGVDRIEVDLQRSLDGIGMLVHDRVILLDGTPYSVTQLTESQIRRAIPEVLNLDELFALNRVQMPLLLDIKTVGLESIVSAAIERHNASKWVTACSMSPRAVRALHHRFPFMPLALTWGGQTKYIPKGSGTRFSYPIFGIATLGPFLAMTRWAGASQATINYRLLNRHLVGAFRSAGLYVITWTIDEPNEIKRALDRGVDAITSNRPELVVASLKQYGYNRLDD